MPADPSKAGKIGGSRNTPARQAARKKNGFQPKTPEAVKPEAVKCGMCPPAFDELVQEVSNDDFHRKFGRRVAALWRTVNRCAAVARDLEAARAEMPTRWQKKQVTRINREAPPRAAATSRPRHSWRGKPPWRFSCAARNSEVYGTLMRNSPSVFRGSPGLVFAFFTASVCLHNSAWKRASASSYGLLLRGERPRVFECRCGSCGHQFGCLPCGTRREFLVPVSFLDIFKRKPTPEPRMWREAISPKTGASLGLQFDCRGCGRKVLTTAPVNCWRSAQPGARGSCSHDGAGNLRF